MRQLTLEECSLISGGEEPNVVEAITVTAMETVTQYQSRLLRETASSPGAYVEAAIGGGTEAVAAGRAGASGGQQVAAGAKAGGVALAWSFVVNYLGNEDLAYENKLASSAYSANGLYNPYYDK